MGVACGSQSVGYQQAWGGFDVALGGFAGLHSSFIILPSAFPDGEVARAHGLIGETNDPHALLAARAGAGALRTVWVCGSGRAASIELPQRDKAILG